MSEVGSREALAPLATVPSVSVRKELPTGVWEACMESWLLLAQRYLLLPQHSFASKVIDDCALHQYFISYVKNIPAFPPDKAAQLRRKTFLLIHRVFTESKPVSNVLLDWNFWVDLCSVYPESKALSELLAGTWIRGDMDDNKSMARYKSALIRALEVEHLNPELEELLRRTVVLVRSCYAYGQFMMLGSDFVDALSSSYEKKPRLRRKLVSMTYFCLMSLMKPGSQRTSTLLDHLYSLKSGLQARDSLLRALAESTPMFSKLRSSLPNQESGRAEPLFQELQKLEVFEDGIPKKPIRKRIDKGKGRLAETYHTGLPGDVHVQKLSLISQIQDLFPELGSAYISKLLDEYHDSVEQVTAHLLDGTLPSNLKEADQFKLLPDAQLENPSDLVPDLAPRTTPPLPPIRRNIYDDDEFDRLAVDVSKVRLGKDQKSTADELLASKPTSSQKAAILSALATFDPDDDERDDTYDVGDVGGTVDTTNDENAADLKLDVHENLLFSAYKTTPDVFNRDSVTRRSKERAALKKQTSMTDEAIEGWGIMVGRDPRRLDRLNRKSEMGSGAQQRALEGTAWRAESGTEDSDAPGADRRNRGGRSRGGRGGQVAGASDDKGTQIARQRKDASKGSRANHSRRDQRARKMARGGIPG